MSTTATVAPLASTGGNLVAFLGGVAAGGGARYKIEVRDLGGTYQARGYSAAAGANWTDQGVVKGGSGTSRNAVFAAALRKFGEKLKAGRDRVYTNPFPGTTSTMQVGVLGGMMGGDLPVHRLVWQVGRSLDTLPRELHSAAMIAPATAQPTPAAQPATAAAQPASAAPARTAAPSPAPSIPAASAQTATPAGTPVPAVAAAAAVVADPFPYGSLVMHPNTIQTEAELMAFISDLRWIMQEKLEGRRAQAHRNLGGEVFMTNRSGERVECPAHIAEALARLAPGTSLDCELIAVDEQGRPALYVGAVAATQVLYAFDLIRSPYLANTADAWQDQRLSTLRRIVDEVGMLDALRMVPTATGTAAKQRLLREVRAREGEGFVLRQLDAPYVSGRPKTCLRWRDRKREIDVVAMPYEFATARWGFQAGIGKQTGLVGAIAVGLYDGSGVLRRVGEVGSGFSDAERAELQRRWDAAQADLAQLQASGLVIAEADQAAFLARHQFVIRVTCMGLTFNDMMIRPSAHEIRPAGDKQPHECTFQSEVGREWGAMTQTYVPMAAAA
jgi:bifunctional non-homologous end joining protein LigD